MSNIPATAIASALAPVQQASHDALRARQIQAQKEMHHSEEVNELEDTAVNSVGDESQEKGQTRDQPKRKSHDPHEVVEIESLSEVPEQEFSLPSPPPLHIDISA